MRGCKNALRVITKYFITEKPTLQKNPFNVKIKKFIGFKVKQNDLTSIRMMNLKSHYSVPILYPLQKRKAPHFCEALSFLVAGTGLEPVTFGL